MALTTLMLTLMVGATLAHAQQGPIQDNSFLIEEAYNQDPGYVQHISAFSHSTRRAAAGLYTFTQEWPLGGVKHQLSYTLPVQDVNSELAAARRPRRRRAQLPLPGSGRFRLEGRVRAAAEPAGADGEVEGRAGIRRRGVAAQPAAELGLEQSCGHALERGHHPHLFGARRDLRQGRDQRVEPWAELRWLAGRRVNLLLETVYAHSQDVVSSGQTA